MMKIQNSAVSVEEIIGTIKNSNLDSVIIEGDEDVIVYRKLEEIYDGLSVMPVGGRENVLKIYDKTVKMKLNKKVIFIVDMDMWIISGIPAKYYVKNLITTDGYSIENDVIRDTNMENYMKTHEKAKFHEELEAFGRWYALEIKRHSNGEESRIITHPSNLLGNPDFLTNSFKLENGESFPTDMHCTIMSNYGKYIRGKSLLALIMRQLSYKGRKPRHRHDSFLETAAVSPGAHVRRIFDEVGINLK